MTSGVWALGDYDKIASLIADMGPDLVAAAGVRPGQRGLDVGAGTGNAAIPAAVAGADVVATDVTPELIAVGERTARERGLAVQWQLADAQALPFADGEFDVVLSCIGAIFSPDHGATARDLRRVCRPDGVVAMANWTPDGAGQFFRLLGRYAEPTGTGPAPAARGDPRHLVGLFGDDVVLDCARRVVRLRTSVPPAELAAYYLRWFPPIVAIRAGLDAERAARLERDLVDFFTAEDRGGPGGPSRYELEYLLVLVRPGVGPTGGRAEAAAARQG
jgi:ubiquinone/menaquinone biosynthesis C-methylase UbiE